jgi:hypothetical protein
MQSIQIIRPHREQVYPGLVAIILLNSGLFAWPMTAPAGRTSSPHALHRLGGAARSSKNLLKGANIPINYSIDIGTNKLKHRFVFTPRISS